MMKQLIKIFTDGSCIGNPGPGGFAVAIVISEKNIKTSKSKHFKKTTNNIMELKAMKCAFDTVIKMQDIGNIDGNFCPFRIKFRFYSDSQYVIKGLTTWHHNWIKRGWKNVKNGELWKETICSFNKLSAIAELEFRHVRAHTTNFEDYTPEYYNNIVDKLAREIAQDQ